MSEQASLPSREDAEIQTLIVENLPRVPRVVRRVVRRFSLAVDHEELVQAGVLGLIDAARRYDPGLGCAFASYSEIRIRGAVVDQLRALDWVSRSIRRSERAVDRELHAVQQRAGAEASAVEAAESLGLAPSAAVRCSVELLGEDELARAAARPGHHDPLDALCVERTRQSIDRALAALPESERGVVSLLYWTDLKPEEVSRRLGIDACRVRALHQRALQRLRVRLRELCE